MSSRHRKRELSSGLQQPAKEAMLASSATQNMGSNAPIVVLDDDDDVDVQICSGTSFARARNSSRNPRVATITDEDLELRLGPTDKVINRPRRSTRACPDRTIVLSDDTEELESNMSKKKKATTEEQRELKLSCAICMNVMTEETSTICGHIFCKKCITSAIQIQKKCPTCRRKLTLNNIHRIYLSSV